MNLWQNPEHDLGQPLSRQQQLLASNGNDGPRSYWFELSSELSTNELKQKLMLLMQTQQALSTYYAKPVGFDVIRQQVQQPRLSLNVFANAEALEFTERVKRTLETCPARFSRRELSQVSSMCVGTDYLNISFTFRNVFCKNRI